MNPIEAALSKIFDVDSLQMDEQHCLFHTLPSGDSVFMRWSEDAGTLLVSLPIGEFAQGQENLRAIFALIANHTKHLTAGGALGLEPETGQLYLSRSFLINPLNEDPIESLGPLAVFCFVAAGLKSWLETVNLLQFDTKNGKPSLPDVSEEELRSAYEEELKKSSEDPTPEWDEQSRTDFSDFANKALAQLDLPAQEPDEDMVMMLYHQDIPLQLHLDPVLEEITLTALLGPIGFEHIATSAAEWLTYNLHLWDSGNSAIGLMTQENEFLLTATYTTPAEALLPDPANLANLLGNFWANADGLRNRLIPAEDVAPEPETEPMVMDLI